MPRDPFFSKPFLYIDVETTGQAIEQGGEMCEIGAVLVDRQTLEPIKELNLMLAVSNPNGRTEEQLSVNHYNRFNFKDWAETMAPRPAMLRLVEFGRGAVPCAWNTAFDRLWVEGYFHREGIPCGYGEPFDHHWVCVMSLWSDYLDLRDIDLGDVKFNMNNVAKWCGVPEEPKLHEAIHGARTAAALHKRYRDIVR
ncbi:MAG: hypothetical protein HY092_01830 [Candidatus Kerfeldbacteria bacterium]|nr:hypothetical protein [Candidatus Kerfeldbacteria bacterium]